MQSQIDRLTLELKQLNMQVADKRDKYVQSLRAARNSQNLKNPVMFIFSAKSFPQIYRRMRYAKEFAALQKNLGLQLMSKQNEARDKQNELLDTKQQMSVAVQEVIRERKQLSAQHAVVQANARELRKQEKEIEKQVAEQQKQLTALNKKIDELVAYEIEQARKRAEAEAKRKREAEERAAKAREEAAKSSKTKKGTKDTKSDKDKGKTKSDSDSKTSKTATRWLTAEDRQLNGNLEQNKGRLPVPITGPYRIERRFGLNRISSTVVLDNKGVNYMGQAGAHARSIFDGEVSAVFQLGSLKNVLVRHGSYISVYCNLKSVSVHRGQQVKTGQTLGTVGTDNILQFQLRKETAKLNPESWLGR
jgi:septal ring factor EnvC (AmiA/AmiB activator)